MSRVTTHLLNQISSQTQQLDRSFSDVQRGVQRLAVRLESLYTLSSSMLVESGCQDYRDLKDLESTRQHHQYQDNWINIETPVCLSSRYGRAFRNWFGTVVVICDDALFDAGVSRWC